MDFSPSHTELVEPPAVRERRLTACEFLRAHDIDPDRVPLDCDLQISDGKVSVDVYVINDDGRKVLPNGESDAPLRTRITVEQVAEWPL